MSELKICNVSVTIKDKIILKNISFEIKKGDFIGIIGPNGKTTLLKVMVGLIKPNTGHIHTPEHTRIGYVPQVSSFEDAFPITVLDAILMGHIKFPLKAFFKASEEDKQKAYSLIDRLGLTEVKLNNVSDLSGGQLQKVLIARALMSDPTLLILDEPTASLDANSKTEIYEILKKLNTDISIVMVTHDIITISSYVKSIGCINKSFHYHESSEFDSFMFEQIYGCPVELIAHGLPHRVLKEHK